MVEGERGELAGLGYEDGSKSLALSPRTLPGGDELKWKIEEKEKKKRADQRAASNRSSRGRRKNSQDSSERIHSKWGKQSRQILWIQY